MMIIITIKISEKYIYKVVEKTGHTRAHTQHTNETHTTHTHTHGTQMNNSKARSVFVFSHFWYCPILHSIPNGSLDEWTEGLCGSFDIVIDSIDGRTEWAVCQSQRQIRKGERNNKRKEREIELQNVARRFFNHSRVILIAPIFASASCQFVICSPSDLIFILF
jgi:hypothetical protein